MLGWFARIVLCALVGWLCGCAAYAKDSAYRYSTRTPADYDVDGVSDSNDAVYGISTAGSIGSEGGDEMESRSFAVKEEMLSEADEPALLAQAPAPPPKPSMGPAPAARERTVALQDATKTAASPQPPSGSTSPPQSQPARPSGSAASEVAAIRAPLLIYTAQITMAVFEVNASLGEVEALGRELGGFLARRDDRSITIRVPAAQFDEAVKRIEKMGDMLHRDVTVEDVTEEFHDLEIRLRSARAVRDRLEQLLTKATKVEESVLIEKELERVAGLIDRMEGRMKFLKDRAVFSTITVVFQARRSEQLNQTNFALPVPWLYDLGLARLLNL